MAICFSDRRSIRQYLKSHMKRVNFRAQTQEFVPKSVFDEITQEEIITSMVSQDEKLQMSPEDTLGFVDAVHRTAPKLFANCVYSGLPMTFLKDLLENGFTDENIPLKEDNCPDPAHEQQFELFVANQKRFNVAFFDSSLVRQLDDSYAMPINFDENPSSLKGKGAFGEVWEVTIHEDHYSFPSVKTTKHSFAMKVIQHEGSAEREKNFVNDIAPLNHPNLVKCLASFTFGAKYYMIYELAEGGNLEEFMQNHSLPSTNPMIDGSWMVKQLYGLAQALLTVHNQTGAANSSQRRHGYIHDIKPANILVFAYEWQIYCFRLSDFSCAKVVDFVATISGQHEISHCTTSKTGTPIYRAPEVHHTGTTSRPYDLWSLGCVYLEVLTWHMQGYAELLAFREARNGLVKPAGAEDEGFCYTTEDATDPRNWQLREPVLAKISELQHLCHGPLRQFVNMIPSLLSTMPEERPTAKELVDTLNCLNVDTSLSRDRKDFVVYSDLSLDSIRRASALLTVPGLKPRKLPSINNNIDLDASQFVVVQLPNDKEGT